MTQGTMRSVDADTILQLHIRIAFTGMPFCLPNKMVGSGRFGGGGKKQKKLRRDETEKKYIIKIMTGRPTPILRASYVPYLFFSLLHFSCARASTYVCVVCLIGM